MSDEHSISEVRYQSVGGWQWLSAAQRMRRSRPLRRALLLLSLFICRVAGELGPQVLVVHAARPGHGPWWIYRWRCESDKPGEEPRQHSFRQSRFTFYPDHEASVHNLQPHRKAHIQGQGVTNLPHQTSHAASSNIAWLGCML